MSFCCSSCFCLRRTSSSSSLRIWFLMCLSIFSSSMRICSFWSLITVSAYEVMIFLIFSSRSFFSRSFSSYNSFCNRLYSFCCLISYSLSRAFSSLILAWLSSFSSMMILSLSFSLSFLSNWSCSSCASYYWILVTSILSSSSSRFFSFFLRLCSSLTCLSRIFFSRLIFSRSSASFSDYRLS